ncbi:MAG: TRAM domain-containing protein, partial [Chloroflexi bacterium]|nr:TRAM domain-containing protein [Chloroflexota bacterium]MBU1752120.1 TRAM domain-containing protein [Chloroflexota bacterium]
MSRIRLSLTAMAHGGEAIGRYQGKVIFVPYALPGENAVVEIVQEKPKYARATLINLVTRSSRRVEPRCPHFGDCGGCQWQHVSYPAQLQFKSSIVSSQLRRVGQFAKPPLRAIVEARDPWGYRNVAHLVVGDGRLGYQAANSHRVVPVSQCPILTPPLERLLTDFELDFPDLAEMTLRAGVNTGDLLAALRVRGHVWPALEIDQPISCVLMARDTPPVVVCGNDFLTEEVGGIRYHISPDSFFQINTLQAAVLVDLVSEALSL